MDVMTSPRESSAAGHGIAADEALSAEMIAGNRATINHNGAGHGIPANSSDEFRIVAELCGIAV